MQQALAAGPLQPEHRQPLAGAVAAQDSLPARSTHSTEATGGPSSGARWLCPLQSATRCGSGGGGGAHG